MRYVIVCTIGRSGSTLLQGILNALDGCCVRGENGNFLLGIYEAYRAMGQAKTIASHKTLPTHPWYGGEYFDQKKFMIDIRRIFDEQLAFPKGTSLAGFKEIRWTQDWLRNVSLSEYIDFLQLLFGDLKIIFLTRDINDIYISQTRAGFPNMEKDFQHFSRHVEKYYSDMRSIQMPVFEIDYNDLLSVSHRMIKMFDFLNIDYEFKNVEQVLSTEHSYANSNKLIYRK